MTKKEWENFGLSAMQRKKLSWDKLDALNLSPIRNPYTGEVRYITADQYDSAFKEDENARYEKKRSRKRKKAYKTKADQGKKKGSPEGGKI